MRTLSIAKKTATWMAYLGLALGVLYSVGGLAYDLVTTGLNWGTAMAFMALVGMPAIFGAFGFLLGALIDVAVAAVGAIRGRTARGDD